MIALFINLYIFTLSEDHNKTDLETLLPSFIIQVFNVSPSSKTQTLNLQLWKSIINMNYILKT